MDILNFFLLLIIVYLIHSSYVKFRSIHPNQLSGPIPIPFLGNLHQLGKLPHRTFMSLQKIYGPIFRLYFGDTYTVVVCSLDIAKEIYIDKFDNFSDRSATTTFELHSSNFSGISSGNGEYWKKNKIVVSKALRRINLNELGVYNFLELQVNQLLNIINKDYKNKKQFPIRTFTQKYSISTMFKYVFSEELNLDDNEMSNINNIAKPIDKIFKELGTGKLGDYINLFKPFFYYYSKYTDKHFYNVKEQVKKRYHEHLSNFNSKKHRDLIDYLIEEFGSDEKKIDIVIQIIFDVLLAGIETTALAIELATMILVNNPEVQEKVYDELRSVVGPNRNRVYLTDKSKTLYTNAMIKENFRTHPSGPFGIPRVAKENCYVGDSYFVPKGAQIIVNFFSLSYNEDIYKNCEQYDPNRFLNSTAHISNEEYYTFGLGPRACLGLHLAIDEYYLFITNLILNYKISSVDGNKINYDENYGLTLKPTEFNLVLEPRN
ncbi:hypothetical protein DICPUDRAFT_45676 [Dictyostelium purpureum]|uniref:Cytochrome P450 family protein n=1 Tax=Dictyostelium purpureum TaxID=5786 RepID=F0ZBC7_DICPU|nr:uncharacterized protein DICPUDRAFT_45676 [Dictyostelium purpureum]EGC38751.1 hypothetical protein DICPUDRAFT_45676 [Dictyostelium purpureum]|eukprot:XP_003284742.1 hypothetical protein DICPUDRAFT_45676 [Dictyostelium purpureum]